MIVKKRTIFREMLINIGTKIYDRNDICLMLAERMEQDESRMITANIKSISGSGDIYALKIERNPEMKNPIGFRC